MRSCISRLLFVACAFTLSLVDRAVAAPFVNLDFEQSLVQPGDPLFVPTSRAFPGWTARIDNAVLNSVGHNYIGIGEPVVSVWDREVFGQGMLLLEGQFMAFLETNADGNRFTSLGQVGDVPGGTRSMTFLCDGLRGPPVFKVNGSLIPTVFISGGIDVARYGADFTPFAGTSVELRFASGTLTATNNGKRTFDDVRFSSEPIPEPTTLPALMALTGLLAVRVNRSEEKVSAKKRCQVHFLASPIEEFFVAPA
ncbi:MAG: PEP-CTERM sorting domain-containing protein [Anaerolineae bacterium]|nr:PEP-CTERM sorting domain-containing protein [Phycisphaerae bacterium]